MAHRAQEKNQFLFVLVVAERKQLVRESTLNKQCFYLKSACANITLYYFLIDHCSLFFFFLLSRQILPEEKTAIIFWVQ